MVGLRMEERERGGAPHTARRASGLRPFGGADRAIAFVVPVAGVEVDEGAVQAHCAGRLAKYKVPAKVVSLEAFPVTESANGIKIQRTKLREMALALVSS